MKLAATFRFLIYSRNNIRAGRFREWQATILMQYVVLDSFRWSRKAPVEAGDGT